MKEVFVNHTLNYLIANNACSKKQESIFRYTLESLYSFLTKMAVVLLLSVFLGTLKITCISLFLYSLLRGFSFGIHATKNIYCWITTLSVYIVFPLVIKYVDFSNIILMLFNFIGVLSIVLWAPADTPKRPLLNQKKRIINKLFAIFLSLFFVFFYVLIQNQNFREVICFILIMNALCICPLTYKVFHIPYNNYKNYKN